jgi:hypothetical protein
MNKIHKFIHNTSLQNRRLSTLPDEAERKYLLQKRATLLSYYNLFILSLKRMLHKKQFRKALYQIESSFPQYQTLTTHLHVLYIIKAQCILKIISKKLRDHPHELLIEKSRQNFSIQFWFNQLYLLLEQLVLLLRPSLNANINLNDESTFEYVEQIVQLHFDMIYQLAKYAFHIKQFPQLFCYFAMIDNIKYFYNYCKHPRTLSIISRLY